MNPVRTTNVVKDGGGEETRKEVLCTRIFYDLKFLYRFIESFIYSFTFHLLKYRFSPL